MRIGSQGGFRKARRKPSKAAPTKLPTLFRRQTLLVASIDNSLRLYRDILGLEVCFDNIVPIGGKGLPTGIFDAKARLVFLKSYEDHMVGVVGLLEYLDKPVPQRSGGARRKLTLGDSVLLLNTTSVAERMEKIKRSLPDVYIQSEGSVDVYPSATGGTMTVLGNSLFDADGHFIELNEVVAS